MTIAQIETFMLKDVRSLTLGLHDVLRLLSNKVQEYVTLVAFIVAALQPTPRLAVGLSPVCAHGHCTPPGTE